MLALAVLLALGLAACGGSGFEDALVGTWEGVSTTEIGTSRTTWEFFEDGTLIIAAESPLGAVPVAGTYVFEDDDTIAIHEDGAPADARPGRRDIRMPDEDTLILTAPVSGAEAVLRRVQEP